MRALDALDVFARRSDPDTNSRLDHSGEARFEFEERAAVLEFDGGYSRAEAERLALLEVNASHQ